MEADHQFLAMELLGPTVSELFKKCHSKFSVKTVLMIADEMLSRLEYMHRKGFVHRDVKPENMAIGRGRQSNLIYIFDFGLTKSYGFARSEPPLPDSANRRFIGTPLFASIRAHHGNGGFPCDDLESLAYSLIYLVTGSLPWMKLADADHKAIEECKKETTIDSLCGDAPDVFRQFLTLVRSLPCGSDVDYSGYRRMFRGAFFQMNLHYDMKWDWKSLSEGVAPTTFVFHGPGSTSDVNLHDSKGQGGMDHLGTKHRRSSANFRNLQQRTERSHRDLGGIKSARKLLGQIHATKSVPSYDWDKRIGALMAKDQKMLQ
jgi:serine/threonine protein kinase